MDNPIPAALLLAGVVAFLLWSRRSPLWGEVRSGLATATATAAVEFDARTRGRPEAAEVAGPKVAAFVGNLAGSGDPAALVARTLALAPPSGLSAAEIRTITGHAFAVRSILDTHPAFVRGDGLRWHLGVPAITSTVAPPWPLADALARR